MKDDATIRADRWRAAYAEEGGLSDMLDAIQRAYFDRAADLMPSDTDKLLKLAMAGKIVDQLRAHIEAIIAAGDVEAFHDGHASKIAEIPARKARWF